MGGVCIVIPNYNHAEPLRISLKAAVDQTTPADQVIVVDDGSTDHSLSVIEEFAQVHANIVLLKNERNRGVAAAVRRGVAAAKTKYVILASADEKIDSEMVESLMAAMCAVPEAKLAISNFAEWYPEQDRVDIHGPNAELGLWYHHGDEPAYISPARLRMMMHKGTVALQATTAIFDRQALLDLDVYDPELRWIGDWFTMHVLAIRHGMVVVPKVLALFRRDGQSYSARGMRDWRAQSAVLDYLMKKLDEPQFQDIKEDIIRSPSSMSPFMNTMLRYAFCHALSSRLCRATLMWWLGQVMHGRRPGFLRNLVRGGEPMAHIRNEVL